MNLTSLEKEKRGRPLLLGFDLDAKVQTHIRLLRDHGSIVNRQIILATGRAYVYQFNRSLLPEYGGSLILSKDWANSIRDRLDFVKRKGTKAARKLPEDFASQKTKYFNLISKIVKEFNIPSSLVINWDQTGINIVPVSDWTLAEKGSKQVGIVGLEDKRQITALFASTLAGEMLPPQLLYQGKKEMCHPKAPYPDGWDIWHSETHWSNEETMIRYIEKVIIPYCNKKRQESLLPLDQEALVIFDVYKAQRTEAVLELLKKNSIRYVFVPAKCTSELQPLDAEGSVNGIFKNALNEQFILWYSTELARKLENGDKEPKINLRLSILKPLHLKWFISAFDKVAQQSAVIMAGWKKTGIFDVYESAFSTAIQIDIV